MAASNKANGIMKLEAAQSSAKAGHINMMDDTVIANLPAPGLRAVLRGLLGTDEGFVMTKNFQGLARRFLDTSRPESVPALFSSNLEVTPALGMIKSRYRCLMGVGQGFQSVELLTAVVTQVNEIQAKSSPEKQLAEALSSVDGDIVQVVTSVQKELTGPSGLREKSDSETTTLENLYQALLACKAQTDQNGQEFPFERGFSRLQMFNGVAEPANTGDVSMSNNVFVMSGNPLESVQLGKAVVPRMFMGLWQFSSPAWGSASRSKINQHFRKHVDCGFTAYDMADHYGDAETTFGHFRSTQPDAGSIFCATKVCYFASAEVTKESIEANITERLTNISAPAINLLQFHWQNYADEQYVKAVRFLYEDPRVQSVGLVNFDTKRMEEIIEDGVKIVSNQVQFSLVDLRPTFAMGDSCRKHDVKLLTYGSLCGGFLADKWLGKSAPSPFEEAMTPSHRKYYEMIIAWGGWVLFQELLQTLSKIGAKYSVTVSNVAVRWVLDHDYVGVAIIGARMGVSEHTEENLKVFSFKLNEADQASIATVLDRCRAREMFDAMGDCGAEYRQ